MKDPFWICGVPVQALTEDEAVEAVCRLMESGAKHYGVTPNPEMVMEASRNSTFKSVLGAASLSVPDGTGMQWAAAWLSGPHSRNMVARMASVILSLVAFFMSPKPVRSPLPARVTGVDLLNRLAQRAPREGWRLFLLGAAPGVAQAAARSLEAAHPGLRIAGFFAGSPHEKDFPAIQKAIAHTQANLVLVAYGSPAQELWISRCLKDLPSVRFAMGVGGALDFASGRVRRAPAFLRRVGLEWLWRLLLQPKRLGRIATAVIRFPLHVARCGSPRNSF